MTAHMVFQSAKAGHQCLENFMHKYLVSIITATTAVMCISAVAFPSAQTEGVKETGQFVNAGDDTSSAVGKARLQVQNTLAGLQFSDLSQSRFADLKR